MMKNAMKPCGRFTLHKINGLMGLAPLTANSKLYNFKNSYLGTCHKANPNQVHQNTQNFKIIPRRHFARARS